MTMKLFNTLSILLSMIPISLVKSQGFLANCPNEMAVYEACAAQNNKTICRRTCIDAAQPEAMQGLDLSQIDPATLDPKLLCPPLQTTKCMMDNCCVPCLLESDAMWKCNLDFLNVECNLSCFAATMGRRTGNNLTSGSDNGYEQQLPNYCPDEVKVYEACVAQNNKTCTHTCTEAVQPEPMQGMDLSQIDPSMLDLALICPPLQTTKCKLDDCCAPCLSESNALWTCNVEYVNIECDFSCATTMTDGSTGAGLVSNFHVQHGAGLASGSDNLCATFSR